MTCTLTKSILETRNLIRMARQSGKQIALVPTMGALHAGHSSLIQSAVLEDCFVVVSIFVNPTQFGPKEDLDKYPRMLEQDFQLCSREGANLVFAPGPEEIYPKGFCTFVEVHGLQNVLCGKSRPTHFRGVTTIVLKLFNIVKPDMAFFGQKDAQQCRVLEQMVRDLDLEIGLRICPIVREADGLAMSSRNQYLEKDQRQNATALYQALQEIRQAIELGSREAENLLNVLRRRLEMIPGAVVDYAEIVDYQTLQSVTYLKGRILVAVAVFFGGTRLIDNLLLDIS